MLGDSTKIQDFKAPHTAYNWRWFIAGAAVLAALGYAAFEWRQELMVTTIRVHHAIVGFRDKFKRQLFRR